MGSIARFRRVGASGARPSMPKTPPPAPTWASAGHGVHRSIRDVPSAAPRLRVNPIQRPSRWTWGPSLNFATAPSAASVGRLLPLRLEVLQHGQEIAALRIVEIDEA